MKIEDVKHNHSLTDLLKILLFAILMLAPIGSVATRCLYVVCNKNAYQSYSNETYEVETKVSLNNFTNAIYNQEYVLNTENVDFTSIFNQASYYMEFSNADWTIPNGAKYFTIGASVGHSDRFSFTYYDGDKNYISYTRMENANTYNFVLISSSTTSASYYTNSLFGATLETFQYVITQEKLDNVFEYSVSQLENDQLFSWTENTLIYTGINNMCTQLNITIAAIPMILTYWLMLTCIYVIIDIVLKLFTLLTHMIGNRKA